MRDKNESLRMIDSLLKKTYGLFSEATGKDIEISPEHPRYLYELEFITKYVPRGGKILDVGCGGGVNVIALQLLGRKSFGVDKYVFRDPVINDLKNVWKTVGVQIEECDISCSPLPYPDESFDCVTCCAVLEHLHSSPKFPLHEMKRVLKQRGIMIITVPNLGAIAKRINFFLGRRHYLPLEYFFKSEHICTGHIREFYPHEIVKLIEWVGGLKIIHLSLFSYGRLPKSPIKALYLRCLNLLRIIYPNFRTSIIVIAQKAEL